MNIDAKYWFTLSMIIQNGIKYINILKRRYVYMEINDTLEQMPVTPHLHAFPQSGANCPLWHPITISLSSTLEIAISFSMGPQVNEHQAASTFSKRKRQ